MALGLSFAFDPQKGETPETVARRRALAEMILGRSLAPKNVGEGWHAIANGVVAAVQNHRANKAEAAGQASAAAAFNPLLDAFRTRLSGGFPAAPSSSNVPNPGNSTSMATLPAPDIASARVAQAHGNTFGDAPTVEGMTSYIREAAAARGIDPDVAVRVARSEGLAPGVWQSKVINKRGQRETSYGPFQLLVGGGLGDKFQEIYGVSPEDRSTWRQQIDFALDQAAEGGWSPWYGAAKVGVGTRTGLERARPLGYQGSAPAPVQATASGMTPDMVQNWAANAYAPPMPANSALDAVNTLGTAQPVPVAETEEDILAQEAAMAAQDPQAFQPGPMMAQPSPGTQPRLPQPVPQQMAAAPAPQPAPPLPDPRMVQDMPVAGLPQQPVQVAQAGGFPEMAGNNPQALPAPGPSIDAILNVLTHPFASEQQRALAQMFLDQHMQAQDPMRQLDMEKKRLEVEQMRNPRPNDTDDIREYQFAVSQGYQGTFQDFMTDMKRAGAMNVNVDTGTIPQGYEAIRDENGRVIRYQPIPGGPADTSAADAAAAESQEVATDTVMEAAKKARQALRGPGLPATGTVGKLMSALPESNAAEVRRQVAVMQATARVENLQAMRAASPTGGALGNVSDAEGAMLAAKAGALDPDSPTFERDLDDYERTLLRIIHGKKVGDAIFEQTREDEGGDWQDFGGVKIRRKQ